MSIHEITQYFDVSDDSESEVDDEEDNDGEDLHTSTDKLGRAKTKILPHNKLKRKKTTKKKTFINNLIFDLCLIILLTFDAQS